MMWHESCIYDIMSKSYYHKTAIAKLNKIYINSMLYYGIRIQYNLVYFPPLHAMPCHFSFSIILWRFRGGTNKYRMKWKTILMWKKRTTVVVAYIGEICLKIEFRIFVFYLFIWYIWLLFFLSWNMHIACCIKIILYIY